MIETYSHLNGKCITFQFTFLYIFADISWVGYFEQVPKIIILGLISTLQCQVLNSQSRKISLLATALC